MSSEAGANQSRKRNKRRRAGGGDKEVNGAGPAPAQVSSAAASEIDTRPVRVVPAGRRHYVRLANPTALDELLKGDTSCVDSVTFGPDFGIRDEHLLRLVEAVGPQLTSLRLGSCDTGDGVWLTSAAVRRVVDCCPHLRTLELSSCLQVDDDTFVLLLRLLLQVEELTVTGHDRSKGALTNKALDPLLREPAVAARLRRLFITDQHVGYEAVQRLIRNRPALRVQAGDTDSDSIAHGLVLGAMGRGYGDGLFGNMGGD